VPWLRWNSRSTAWSTTCLTFDRQPPQRRPAPVAIATSRVDVAPSRTRRRICRSLIPRQWQTSIEVFLRVGQADSTKIEIENQCRFHLIIVRADGILDVSDRSGLKFPFVFRYLENCRKIPQGIQRPGDLAPLDLGACGDPAAASPPGTDSPVGSIVFDLRNRKPDPHLPQEPE